MPHQILQWHHIIDPRYASTKGYLKQGRRKQKAAVSLVRPRLNPTFSHKKSILFPTIPITLMRANHNSYLPHKMLGSPESLSYREHDPHVNEW